MTAITDASFIGPVGCFNPRSPKAVFWAHGLQRIGVYVKGTPHNMSVVDTEEVINGHIDSYAS